MTDNKSKLCILPMSRIKMVMKGSPEVDNISNEAIFVMTKAAEGFIALLLQQALKASQNKKQVDYPDLANIVKKNETFIFLRDIIPPKIKGSEYLEILKRIEEREKRIAFEDKEL